MVAITGVHSQKQQLQATGELMTIKIFDKCHTKLIMLGHSLRWPFNKPNGHPIFSPYF